MPSGLNATERTLARGQAGTVGSVSGLRPASHSRTAWCPTARGQALAVRAERHRPRPCLPSLATQDWWLGLGCPSIPQPHRAVVTARGQGRAIRAERHRRDRILVATQDVGSALGVPSSHSRTVVSPPPEARVLPSGLNATDMTTPAMAAQDGGLSPGRAQIPQPHGVVATARGQGRAVRAERHRQTHPCGRAGPLGLSPGGPDPTAAWCCRHCPRPGACHPG